MKLEKEHLFWRTPRGVLFCKSNKQGRAATGINIYPNKSLSAPHNRHVYDLGLIRIKCQEDAKYFENNILSIMFCENASKIGIWKE